MRKTWLMTMLLIAAVSTLGQEDKTANQIREALLPLPEPLRDGATVVFEATPGKRTVLRKGNNGVICRANTSSPRFNVYCYQENMDAFWTRFEQLKLEGKSTQEILQQLTTETNTGKLKTLTGVALYRLEGSSIETSLPITSVFVPYATPESTGFSAQPDHYRPCAVEVSSSHHFEEEIGAASSENGLFIAKMEFSVRTAFCPSTYSVIVKP